MPNDKMLIEKEITFDSQKGKTVSWMAQDNILFPQVYKRKQRDRIKKINVPFEVLYKTISFSATKPLLIQMFMILFTLMNHK